MLTNLFETAAKNFYVEIPQYSDLKTFVITSPRKDILSKIKSGSSTPLTATNIFTIGETQDKSLVRWLDVLRSQKRPSEEDENTLCDKVTRLSRLLAGTDPRLRRSIINHILESDFRSWGQCPVVNADVIKRRTLDADEYEDLSGRLASLTIAAFYCLWAGGVASELQSVTVFF